MREVAVDERNGQRVFIGMIGAYTMWRARVLGSAMGLALSGFVAACGSSVAPVPLAERVTRDDDALFQTDSLAYTLRAESSGFVGEVGVTFTNRSGATVYIVKCNGATGLILEKRIEGQWKNVWSPVIPLCLSAPITVAAGATYRTSVWIFGGYPGSNTYPQFSTTEIAGEYRATWFDVLSSYQDRLPFGDPLPIGQRVSNRFMLATESR